jgi:hypothetical protein
MIAPVTPRQVRSKEKSLLGRGRFAFFRYP